MQKIFIKTFDSIKIGEECKHRLKNTLIEYQSNSVISKKAKKRKLKWTARRIVVAASTAAVMIFCAIFIPVMAFGSGNNNSYTIYKAELLSAVGQLKIADSYEEIIEITTNIDGPKIVSYYTTKYKKINGSYIAEGIMKSEETSQIFYFANGFMYVPVTVPKQPQNQEQPPAWTQISGIKIRLQEELVSICQFFAKNSGFVSPDTINSLSKESGVKKTEKGATYMYTFKAKVKDISEEYPTIADYAITVESKSGRILKIQQNNTTTHDGRLITGNLNADYIYGNTEVNLPDNLDTYVEYTG